MNFMKKFLLISMLLLLLTGCSNGSSVVTNEEEAEENNRISLNVTQADLIANITDNIKYLNKDLLHELDTLDDSDTVNVIVSLKSNGLVDAYNEAPEEIQKLRIYSNAAQYVDEFATYEDGYEDFFSYYSQQCEKDARKYAEDAVADYYSRINEYLEGGSE